MTALTDVKALMPNAAAKAAVVAKCADYNSLLQLVQQHVVELNALITQVKTLHSGDATTLTALNNILAELA